MVFLGSDVNSIPTAIFNKDGLWMQSNGETGNTKPQTKTLGGYTYSNTYASSTYTLLTNPTTHYCGATGNVIIDNPNTWTPYSTSVTKSIYDPCPYGYRVPTNGSWDKWDNPGNKWTAYTVNEGTAWQNSWWPVPGLRYGSSTALCYIGYYGRYWSASRYSSNVNQACDLHYNCNGGVNTSLNDDRSSGFSVRCIAE